jgi:hypothetical protein
MEELQTLVGLVKDLPNTAIAVLIGFWCYKVIWVGSIYGVVKLAIVKSHDVLVARKNMTVEIRPMIDGMCVADSKEALIAQLHRLRDIKEGYGYIHMTHVDILRRALDSLIDKPAGQVQPGKSQSTNTGT